MNAFCSLEDGLEELEELEENRITYSYYSSFFLPISFQPLEDAGRKLEESWKNEVPHELGAAQHRESFRAP